MARRTSASPQELNETATDRLTESVDRLTTELQVLRIVLDDLRSEIQYLVRNPGDLYSAEPTERLRVTSLPLDPAAEDFDDRVNSVPGQTITNLRATGEATQGEMKKGPSGQRGLF